LCINAQLFILSPLYNQQHTNDHFVSMPTLLGTHGLTSAKLEISTTVGFSNAIGADGNPTPNVKRLQVEAWLLPSSRPPRDVAPPQPGNRPQDYYEGRITKVVDLQNPTVELPPIIEKPPKFSPCTINEVPGRFYWCFSPTEPEIIEYGFVNIAGGMIRGFFEREETDDA
jgi:hypothetical protein